jgi:hypothetical protein
MPAYAKSPRCPDGFADRLWAVDVYLRRVTAGLRHLLYVKEPPTPLGPTARRVKGRLKQLDLASEALYTLWDEHSLLECQIGKAPGDVRIDTPWGYLFVTVRNNGTHKFPELRAWSDEEFRLGHPWAFEAALHAGIMALGYVPDASSATGYRQLDWASTRGVRPVPLAPLPLRTLAKVTE